MYFKITPMSELAQKTRINVRQARAILEDSNMPSADDVKKYVEYLRNLIHCPTAVMVAEQEQRPIISKGVFARNKKYLENEVGPTKARAESARRIYQFNYPNTGKLRKYIIKHNRIALDKVLPRRGYNRLQKFLIRMVLKK